MKLIVALLIVFAFVAVAHERNNACANFEREWLAENERAEMSGEYELDASEYAASIGFTSECEL